MIQNINCTILLNYIILCNLWLQNFFSSIEQFNERIDKLITMVMIILDWVHGIVDQSWLYINILQEPFEEVLAITKFQQTKKNINKVSTCAKLR